MNAVLLAILATYHPPVVILAVQDIGMGHCASMDQHWHKIDDTCHRDSDDSVVKILPKVNN